MKVHRRHILLFLSSVLIQTTLVAVVSQEYDYDGGDYQQDYGGDYYGGGASSGGYYADETDTLYQDYARHQQEKAMGIGGG